MKRQPTPEKLRANIEVDEATGCHNWTRAVNAGGYGRLFVAERRVEVGAHRVAYELAKGLIPNGLQIDHLCRNRRCCNPEHLEAVTPRENVLRSLGPAATNHLKTHCRYGHAFDAANTHINKAGHRECRACWRARSQRRDWPAIERRRTELRLQAEAGRHRNDNHA